MKNNNVDNKYVYWGITILSVLAIGLLFFFFLLRWESIFNWFKNILSIFTPFIVGFVIAYLLTPLLKLMEDKVFGNISRKLFKKEESANRFSRSMSLIASTLILILILGGFFSFVIPELVNTLNTIISNVPYYLNNFENALLSLLDNNEGIKKVIVENYDTISASVVEYFNGVSVGGVVNNISTGILNFVSVLYNIIIGYIIAIYYLFGKERFIAQGKKLLYTVVKPDKAYIIIDNLRYTNKIFGGFLLGKVIDSLIIGIICFIFMLVLDMPYPLLLAVIVGITNIIPYFGPFIGAIPCLLFILLVSPSKTLVFLIFIIILQQFDGNVLGPKILGDKTGLQSFWVLFAIIVFGGLFGFVGMLIGVPLFAIIYAFFNGVCSRRLAQNKLPLSTNEFAKINYIDPVTNKPVYYTKKSKTN